MTRARARRVTSVVFWASVFGALSAWAEPVDPSIAVRSVVGSVGAPGAMDGLDGARDNLTRLTLPRHARVVWRARLDGHIPHGVAVDRDGDVIVAHAATRLTTIDKNGAVLGSARLGNDEPMGGPVITSDGTRVVVTSSAVWGVRRDGTPRFRVPFAATRNTPAPLATEDGSIVVASEQRLLWIESDGGVRASASAPERIVALVADSDTVLAVTEPGTILEFLAWGTLSARGSFGGTVSECTLGAPHRIVALVAGSRLMDYSLGTGVRRVVFDVGGGVLFGPLARGADGGTWVSGRDGLRELSTSGHESRTVPLSAATAPRPREGALVVDTAGHLAFAVSGIEVVLAAATGEVVRVDGSACDDVSALVPAGDRRLIVACSSGLVAALAD